MLVISTIISMPVANTATLFWQYMIISCLIQIVIYNFYTTYVDYKFAQIAQQREAELSKQGVEVSCPCSQNLKLFIPIILDKDNSFKCLECSKNVAVAVNVKTFLTTEPVNLEKSDLALNAIYDKVVQEKNKNGI
jgi:hypothetical protein